MKKLIYFFSFFAFTSLSMNLHAANFKCEVDLYGEQESLYFDQVEGSSYELTRTTYYDTESFSCSFSEVLPFSDSSYVSRFFEGGVFFVCDEDGALEWYALFGGNDGENHATIFDEDHYFSFDSCQLN